MGLKYQCNQDPRKMKTVNGKKRCELCNHLVHDARKYSLPELLELKKSTERVCVIIHQHQLDEAEEKEKISASFKKNLMLPYAAGVAALSLFANNVEAQSCPPGGIQTHQTTQHKDSQGKSFSSKGNPVVQTQEEYSFKGKIKRKGLNQVEPHTITLAYYKLNEDSTETYIEVTEFSCDSRGHFSFSLTPEQMNALKKEQIIFSTSRFNITCEQFDPADSKKPVKLLLEKRILVGFY